MYGRTYVCTHAGRYRNVCVCARTTADTGQRVSELGSSASAQSVVGADTVAEHPGIEAMHQAPASLIACNNIEARHHARRRRSQPADEAAQAPRHPSRGRVEASNARVARAHARTHAQNPRKHARGGAGGLARAAPHRLQLREAAGRVGARRGVDVRGHRRVVDSVARAAEAVVAQHRRHDVPAGPTAHHHQAHHTSAVI